MTASRGYLGGEADRLQLADDRLWGPAPHSSPSPPPPLPLIVCLRQTSGTTAPGHYVKFPVMNSFLGP